MGLATKSRVFMRINTRSLNVKISYTMSGVGLSKSNVLAYPIRVGGPR